MQNRFTSVELSKALFDIGYIENTRYFWVKDSFYDDSFFRVAEDAQTDGRYEGYSKIRCYDLFWDIIRNKQKLYKEYNIIISDGAIMTLVEGESTNCIEKELLSKIRLFKNDKKV